MRLYAALFAIGLVVYGLFAWDRIGKPSGAPHFVYQADAWLHGHVSIPPSCGPCGPDVVCDPVPPACAPNQAPLPNDDWAFVETVELDDGTRVEGRRRLTPPPCPTRPKQGPALPDRAAPPHGGAQVNCEPPRFQLLGGGEVAMARVKTSIGFTAYNSFPPVPALIMLPGALISGRDAGDVLPTLVLAALILPLMLLVLRRLAAAGLSARGVREDLWLVALLAFGSVLFFSAVQGKVWYTAHVVGMVLALVYAWASIEARHPVIAGVALGLAALTRTSMAFMLPLFVLEAWRTKQLDARTLARFAIPVAAFAILGVVHNYVRFASLTEFGHTYLSLGDHRPVRQQLQIEQYGLAHYHYLGRNLAVALTLLPDLMARPPWIQISGHGLALWVTTPALLLLLWPRERNPLHRTLWITTACVAIWPLLYMNSGWVQFGYRFSLDFMVFLVMLLAIGGRPLTRAVKGLIIAGIVINAFGAATFDREWRYYRVGGNAGDVVVPHV